MARADTDLLEDLWSGVIHSVSQDSPQNRAFLTLTKPLGLLKNDGGSNLLVAAPNGFAKDVLESRLKVALNDALSAKLGERINIAVTIDESLDVPAAEEEVELESPRAGTGRQETQSKPQESAQLNPRYIFETFVIGASNRFAHAAAVAVAEASKGI
jgi:chromosomal replication initiator protein